MVKNLGDLNSFYSRIMQNDNPESVLFNGNSFSIQLQNNSTKSNQDSRKLKLPIFDFRICEKTLKDSKILNNTDNIYSISNVYHSILYSNRGFFSKSISKGKGLTSVLVNSFGNRIDTSTCSNFTVKIPINTNIIDPKIRERFLLYSKDIFNSSDPIFYDRCIPFPVQNLGDLSLYKRRILFNEFPTCSNNYDVVSLDEHGYVICEGKTMPFDVFNEFHKVVYEKMNHHNIFLFSCGSAIGKNIGKNIALFLFIILLIIIPGIAVLHYFLFKEANYVEKIYDKDCVTIDKIQPLESGKVYPKSFFEKKYSNCSLVSNNKDKSDEKSYNSHQFLNSKIPIEGKSKIIVNDLNNHNFARTFNFGIYDNYNIVRKDETKNNQNDNVKHYKLNIGNKVRNDDKILNLNKEKVISKKLIKDSKEVPKVNDNNYLFKNNEIKLVGAVDKKGLNRDNNDAFDLDLEDLNHTDYYNSLLNNNNSNNYLEGMSNNNFIKKESKDHNDNLHGRGLERVSNDPVESVNDENNDIINFTVKDDDKKKNALVRGDSISENNNNISDIRNDLNSDVNSTFNSDNLMFHNRIRSIVFENKENLDNNALVTPRKDKLNSINKEDNKNMFRDDNQDCVSVNSNNILVNDNIVNNNNELNEINDNNVINDNDNNLVKLNDNNNDVINHTKEKLNDDFLDNLIKPKTIADLQEISNMSTLRYDKRSFIDFFWYQLKEKINILSLILIISVKNPFLIRLLRFSFLISLTFSINSMLFSHVRIDDQEDYKAENQVSFVGIGYLFGKEILDIIIIAVLSIILNSLLEIILIIPQEIDDKFNSSMKSYLENSENLSSEKVEVIEKIEIQIDPKNVQNEEQDDTKNNVVQNDVQNEINNENQNEEQNKVQIKDSINSKNEIINNDYKSNLSNNEEKKKNMENKFDSGIISPDIILTTM